MIGNTPLIRLDKISRSEGLKCELCEYVAYEYLSLNTSIEYQF